VASEVETRTAAAGERSVVAVAACTGEAVARTVARTATEAARTAAGGPTSVTACRLGRSGPRSRLAGRCDGDRALRCEARI
jgi:hypothetical protein